MHMRQHPEPGQAPGAPGTGPAPSGRRTPRPPGRWAQASELLDTYNHAAARARDPGTTPADLWATIESVDTVPVVRHRLDRSEVERTPRALWGRLLPQFTAACMTGLARKAGVLGTLERSGLVVFPFAGSADPLGSIRPGATAPGAQEHADDIPALVPVAKDIPFFSADFLGLLQNSLDWHMANKRLFARPRVEIHSLTALVRIAHEGIKPVRLYQETFKSMAQYLQLCHPGRDSARMEETASDGAPFVFMWLTCLGLLDDIIDGLLLGMPVIRKPTGPKDVFGFQRNGQGTVASLRSIGPD